MKITAQSTNELELKDGSTNGMVISVAFILGGVLAGYYARQSQSLLIWLSPAMIIGGILGILFSSSITVSASKATGQLRYQKKRLVGKQDTTYAIADVFRIETRKQWRIDNTPATNQNAPVRNPVLVAQSVIVFKDGRELPLDHQKSSNSMGVGSTVLMSGQGAETAMAAQVAKFLDVPFQEIAPPNMGSGINIISGSGQFRV